MKDIYTGFDNYDRFNMPKGVYRITAGKGGEAYLIDGGGETAIYDCGMAYCAEEMVENSEKLIERFGELKYILLSHTHYDHIGGLPYLLDRWPRAKVVASSKAASVFKSKGALNTIKRLSESALNTFMPMSNRKLIYSPLRVDIQACDFTKLNFGAKSVICYETKGHTDCSLSFMIEPDGILFLSESTGVLRGYENLTTAILKSYEDTVNSAIKCEKLGAEHLICNHFGAVPEFYNKRYFRLYIESAEEEKNLILSFYKKGLCADDILKEYKKHYFTEERAAAQPEAAFMENAVYIIRHIIDLYESKQRI